MDERILVNGTVWAGVCGSRKERDTQDTSWAKLPFLGGTEGMKGEI